MDRIGINSIVILMSVVMAFSFSSCDMINGNKSKVVGHWRYSETSKDVDEDSNETNVVLTYVTTYDSDGSSHDSGTVTYSLTYNDEESDLYGVEISLTYSFKSYGTFNVSGTTLTETVNDVNISFKSAKTNLSSVDKELEKELIKIGRETFEENDFKTFKNTWYGTGTYEIVTVNDTKMVLKGVDEDGESSVREYERLYEAR